MTAAACVLRVKMPAGVVDRHGVAVDLELFNAEENKR
jgi:hypothetical protein